MAAYAALVSLMNNILQIMNHPRLSTSFDDNQIHPLLEKAGSLLHFIEANNHGGGSKEAQDLEREIASAAHAAEDVIESHIVDQIYSGTNETSFSCSLTLQRITHDIDAVMKKANEFKGNQELGEEQPTPVMVEIGKTAMVGLDAELEHFLNVLTFEHPSNLHIISIVGMGEAKTEDALGLQLHKKLFGRRYLLILDDIWNFRAWDEVRRFFPDNKSGSRIVLTTRLLNVAKDCGSSPYMMKFLDEDNSRKLFWEKALKKEPCPPQLKRVGEEIVKLCKGLALSIVVMGGLLLKSPKTVEYWNGVVKDIKSISDSREKQESLDVLSLSYNHLPPHLKPCFLYMGVYKEDSQIYVSNITKLWIAEGFIKPNGYQDLEEIGEGYIKDLIDRNMLLIGRLRKNGKIRSCGIHDLLRDLSIQIGEQQEFFQETNRIEFQLPEFLRVLEYQGSEDSTVEFYGNVNIRYLACYQSDIEAKPTVWKLPSSVSLLWNLQTLIMQGYWSSKLVVAPTEIWKMRQLRHVDCGMIYLPRCNETMNLENLLTLKTVLNVSLCDEVCKSIRGIKKLYLQYERMMDGYDDCFSEHLCNLHRLDKLESLDLSFKNTRWPYLDKKLSFPMSLNKLCLSYCQFEWEDLTVMGSLPQLQVLMLENFSVQGREWSPINGQFQHLKFLKIDNPELEHWNADHSHFPLLEKLVLHNMYSLEEIPEEFSDIPTLELIRVENCSRSAAISAVKIKQLQVDNDSDSLQIQFSLVESRVKDFKKMMDSEGLSTSNIQFY